MAVLDLKSNVLNYFFILELKQMKSVMVLIYTRNDGNKISIKRGVFSDQLITGVSLY